MSSALLVAAVGAILLAGLILRTSGADSRPERRDSAAPPPLSLPLGATVAPEVASQEPGSEPPAAAETPAIVETPAVVEAPAVVNAPAVVRAPATSATRPVETPSTADPLLVKLAARAEGDCSRLDKLRGRFTSQLLVACKPETVDRLLDTAGGSTKLYVLPAQIREEACFRVCFGTYASAKEAAAAADLPKSLRGKDKIAAVAIAAVLP
jgi:septal ring-binding cell division protein DamX